MKYYLLAIVVFIVGCKEKPKVEEQVNWYKGNLHTHTLWSDGDDYPEMIIEWYKERGYDFLALSDHNTFQDTVKWVPVTKSPVKIRAFERYMERFGKEWVETREDSTGIKVKLKTFDEFQSKLAADSNFILIRSEEITNSFEGKPIHVNGINLQEEVSQQTGGSVVEVMQKAVDAVNSQKERTGVPMFPHINHPNFRWGISLDDMIALNGERFFEVYNGHPLVNNYGDSAHISTEEMWDKINISYLRAGKPIMYGIATDDSHNYHLFGSQFSNAGRGWVVIRAAELNANQLVTAMENGQFYASTGVELEDFTVTESEFSVKVKSEEQVNYIIEFIGVRKDSDEIEVFQSTKEAEAVYKFTGDELFVRARITSNDLQLDPFQVGDYKMAWVQPVIPSK